MVVGSKGEIPVWRASYSFGGGQKPNLAQNRHKQTVDRMSPIGRPPLPKGGQNNEILHAFATLPLILVKAASALVSLGEWRRQCSPVIHSKYFLSADQHPHRIHT